MQSVYGGNEQISYFACDVVRLVKTSMSASVTLTFGHEIYILWHSRLWQSRPSQLSSLLALALSGWLETCMAQRRKYDHHLYEPRPFTRTFALGSCSCSDHQEGLVAL